MARSLAVLLAISSACACKAKTKNAATDASPPGPTRDAPPRRAPSVDAKAVHALVEAWLKTQNEGDFAAYSALYGDGFTGVRRSGSQVVRLDRAGWLADRERMFEKPMQVAVTDVAVAVAPGRADVRFVQSWSSGTYSDVGPKELLVALQGGALKIVREELLASLLVEGSDEMPLASPSFLFVDDSGVVLAEDPAEWAKGRPQLESPSDIPARDPECDRDPPDYEQENERYFACRNAEPDHLQLEFEASTAVDEGRLPSAHKSWKGQKLAFFGGSAPCEATVTGFRIVARRTSTLGTVGVTKKGDLAAEILESGRPILVGALDQPCAGAVWARAASAGLSPPEIWGERKVQADDEQRATGLVGKLDGAAGLSDWEPAKATIRAFASPKGERELLVAGDNEIEQNCEAEIVWGVWEVRKGKATLLYEETIDPMTVHAVVDVNRDGWPEIVLADGMLIHDGDAGYKRWSPLAFPNEIKPCFCGCDD